MITIIFVAFLGVLSLIIELLNLRKFLIPVISTGLVISFGLTYLSVIGDYYSNMLNIDGIFITSSRILILITFLIVLMSDYFYTDRKDQITDYISIKIFILAGALAMVSFGNLAMFFIGVEILSISLYILVASNTKDEKSNEAAFKYFLLGSLASGFLLLGIAFIYLISGSFDLSEIAQAISKDSKNIFTQIGVLLVFISIFFKASLVPFHFWSPDVYEGSPILTTAQMSTLVKVTIFASFFKLVSIAFVPLMYVFNPIIAILCALSMTIGNLSAFKQTNTKRLLAFSGIANAGFMLLAILAPTKGFNSILFYTSIYSIASMAIFSVAINLFKETNNESISAFNGLAKNNPFIAFLITISLISIAGIPPLAGFWGKYYLFAGVVKDYLWLVVVAVLNSVASIFIYFKFIWAMYLEPNTNKINFKFQPTYTVILVLCALLLVVLGIYPDFFLNI
ncbi:MAG: NADH-quinone oxidoreductase subunit N [Solirubrobacteraceae bacterium]